VAKITGITHQHLELRFFEYLGLIWSLSVYPQSLHQLPLCSVCLLWPASTCALPPAKRGRKEGRLEGRKVGRKKGRKVRRKEGRLEGKKTGLYYPCPVEFSFTL
jgi:hypothetical protein